MRRSRALILVAFAGASVFLAHGVFAARDSGTVRLSCESERGARVQCPAETSSGVVLAESTGEAACTLGKTWGYDDHAVWVADGCGADFLLSARSGAEAVTSSAAEQQENDAEDGDDLVATFEPYSRIQAHVAVADDEAELLGSPSWVGFMASVGEETEFFAHVEWALNFVNDTTSLAPGASTDSGFATATEVNTDLLSNRLGFVGVDFHAGGRLSLGKQSSPHYDIANYTTDHLTVFGGGVANSTYPAGTDGGETGTGRADNAVVYRNTLADIVDVGGQIQFRNKTNDHFADGFGASVQISPRDVFTFGASYTRTAASNDQSEFIRGLDGDSQYFGLGAKFQAKRLYLGITFTSQTNGDAVFLPEAITPSDPDAEEPDTIPIVMDGKGFELYGRYDFDAFSIVGGYADYNPDTDDLLIDSDLKVRYFVIGGEYHATTNTYAYTELKIESSVNADGSKPSSVFAVGFRYNFNWRVNHGL